MLQRTLPAGFIAPCLPTKADTLPSGSQWLHEIKAWWVSRLPGRAVGECGSTEDRGLAGRPGMPPSMLSASHVGPP